MKKLLAILFFCSLGWGKDFQLPLTGVGPGANGSAGPPPTFTPVKLHMESGASSGTVNSLTTTVNRCPTATYCLPMQAASAGNTWVFFGAYQDSGTTTLTVSDQTCGTSSCTNAGDTCTIRATSAAINSTKLFGGECKNLTAGVNQLSVLAGASGTITQIRVNVSEWNNIDTSSPFDTSSTNTNAGSTTITAGSLTPGASNKMLFQYGVRTQTPVSASCGHSVSDTLCFTPGSQSNITWVQYLADTIDGQFLQAGQYSVSSAINPQFTMAASSGWGSIALSYNTASAGSGIPAGFGIQGITHVHQATGPSTLHLQARFEGNTRIINAGPGLQDPPGDYTITAVASSDGCSWAQPSISPVGDTHSGKGAIWYAKNCSTDNNDLIDVTFTGTATDYSLHILDGKGLDANPFISAYGYILQSIPAGATMTALDNNPIACGFDNCLAVGNGQQAFNTSQTVSTPSQVISNAVLYGGEDLSGGGSHPGDEENFWGWGNVTGGAGSLWTIGQADAGTAVSAMSFIAAFFKVSGANQTAIVDDNCTRANQSPMTAKLWTPEFGKSSFDLTSNKCVPHSLSSDGGNIYTGAGSTVTFNNNQWAQCTLSTLTGTGSRSGIGVFLRASTSARTEYRVVVNSNTAGNNTFIDKCVAGTCTNLTSFNYTTHWASGQIVEAEVNGTTITVRDGGTGGTSVTTATDSAVTSGFPGMAFSSSMTAASCTAFKAGNL